MSDETITIKPQTRHIHLYMDNDAGTLAKHSVTLEIKKGKTENRISIGRNDIFFDKDGDWSGDGLNLEGHKLYNKNKDIAEDT